MDQATQTPPIGGGKQVTDLARVRPERYLQESFINSAAIHVGDLVRSTPDHPRLRPALRPVKGALASCGPGEATA